MALSDRVLDGLGPALRDRAGALLEPLVEGLTSELEATDDALATTTDRPWAAVFDLDATPFPRWLGAATGTTVPPGLTAAQQRDYVRDQAAWRRGRIDAIAAAVRTVLVGDQRVGFVERLDGNAWRLSIVAYAPDADGVTEAQILAAAATQKPVGLVIDGIETVPAVTYADLSMEYPTYADLEAAWPAFPVSPERDIPGVTWWRPSGTVLRYARTSVLAPTYADRTAAFATYRDSRDFDPITDTLGAP